MTSFYCLMI